MDGVTDTYQLDTTAVGQNFRYFNYAFKALNSTVEDE